MLTLIKELCLGTESEVWIKNIKCGRVAMQALRTHYDGPDEAKKRTLEAESKLKALFYRHEYTFSFEKFITQMQGHFKVFERYGMPMYEHQKVEKLFEKCQNSNPEFKLEVGICRSQQDTFIGAITYLKIAVARIFPGDGRKGMGRSRQISSAKVNGVDLSDFTKNYTSAEVSKLKSTEEGKKAWYAFLKDPRRKRHNREYKKRKNSDARRVKALQKKQKASEGAPNNHADSSGTSNASDMNEDQQRIVAATINGVMNASRHNAQQLQFPINGRHANVKSAQKSGSGSGSGGAPVSSELTFDHLGNPVL